LRIPVSLAWIILILTLFTAGLLRQFNDHTPMSPYVPPIVGSLLFACIVFVLLVAAREWRRGAVPGPGIRLGSLTPVVLMLLIEKWIALTLYNPIFYWISNASTLPAYLDAQYRAFVGVGLLLACLLVAPFSRPTFNKTWRRLRPARLPVSITCVTSVVAGTYLTTGALSWFLDRDLQVHWPEVSPLLWWVLGGQAMLALAEEVYFRGLLLSEIERLAPRLGIKRPTARRWVALLLTATLFGMEHLMLTPSMTEIGRRMLFTVALGLLFGLLVMVSANLQLAVGIHAWINWLLLGGVPYFTDSTGRSSLPAGLYIGSTLIFAFIAVMILKELRSRHKISPVRH
jgi:membrane protease YdiL (CAAX protease family)